MGVMPRSSTLSRLILLCSIGAVLGFGLTACDVQDLSVLLRQAEQLPSAPGRGGSVCGPQDVGDSWSVDCNTCTCKAEGVVECTIIDCEGGGWPAWH